ncbi:hypothetical protein KW800_02815, partial [Candidatus Parcubacteria bacterium]|nr:hypothetical protein [Candidatus Parcubacteria bacterium]
QITGGLTFTSGTTTNFYPTNLLASGSTTLQSFTAMQGTTTSATSTNLYTTGQTILAGTSGNVGIGTTTPGQKLEVNGLVMSLNASGGATSQSSFVSANPTDFSSSLSVSRFGSTAAGTRFGVNQANAAMVFTNLATADASLLAVGTSGAIPLIFGTNNAERVRIDSSGNVGIGTTTPIAKLDIFNIVSSANAPLFSVASSTNGTGTSTALYITNIGNIGIGTTTPSSKFVIAGGSDNRLDIDGSSRVAVELRQNFNVFGSFALAGGTNEFATGAVNKDIVIRAIGTNKLHLATGASPSTARLTIDSNGNVGIGVTSPGARFQVSGGSLDGSTLTDLGISTALTTGRTGAYESGSLASLSARGDASSVELIAGSSATFYSGFTATANNASTLTGTARIFTAGLERLRITNSGNVGIGTTTPIAKLDIFNTTSSSIAPLFSVASSTSGTGTSTAFYIAANGNIGIGTTTPQYVLTAFSSTAPQLALSAGAGVAQWAFRNAGGNFYLATTTTAGDATSSPSVLTIMGSSGFVGIGTTTPAYKFVVMAGDTTNTSNGFALAPSGSGGNRMLVIDGGKIDVKLTNSNTVSTAAHLVLQSASGAGNVGIVTTNPGKILDIGPVVNTDGVRISGHEANVSLLLNNTGTGGVDWDISSTGAGHSSGNGNLIFSVGFGTPTVVFQSNGNVTFANYGAGNCCSDVAEFYHSSEPVQAADLMSVDPNAPVATLRKARGSSDKLIGIVSTNPALVIEEQHLRVAGGIENYVIDPMKPVIALAGRVPVKFSSENGEVQTGDNLTVSETIPGYAAKLVKSGQSVGVALEGSEGKDRVMTYVSLAYQGVAGEFALASSTSIALADLGSRMTSLESRVAFLESASSTGSTSSIYASSGLTLDATTTQSLIAIVLESIKADIVGGVTHFIQLAVDSLSTYALTVGKTDKPAGITVYDEDTGAPFCLKVKSGVQVSSSGACGAGQTSEPPVMGSQNPPTDTPAPPVPDDTASSTPNQSDSSSDGPGQAPASDPAIPDTTQPAPSDTIPPTDTSTTPTT